MVNFFIWNYCFVQQVNICTTSRTPSAKLSCLGDPTQNPQANCHQRNLIIQTRPYTGTHGGPPPAIHREEASPGGFGKALFFIFHFLFILNFCTRRTSFARGGPASHQLFFSTVGDGLARARAPRPRAAQLYLCTPENLASRDDSGSTLLVLY